MNKITYLEELKRGNKTLTSKIECLEIQVLSLQQEKHELMKEKHMLEMENRKLQKQLEDCKRRLFKYESQNPLSYLDKLFNKI